MSRTKRIYQNKRYSRRIKTKRNWYREDSAIGQLREAGFIERDGQRCLARPSFKAPCSKFDIRISADNETNNGRFNVKNQKSVL